MNIGDWGSSTQLWDLYPYSAVSHPWSADVEQQLWLLRSSRNGNSSHQRGAALAPEGRTWPLRTLRSDQNVNSGDARAMQQQW